MRFTRHVRTEPARPAGELRGGAAASFARISNPPMAGSLLIFSYGLFTIAAQALLFREFITTFEGNDISVGIFFASWFLWVGLGAILVYRAKAFAEKLLKNIEFLFLCYLPAFVLELILIIQARELAGIETYELLPIKAILLLSIVVNAPVSIITGMLFPIACRWVLRDSSLVTRDSILRRTTKDEPSDERRATGHELPVSRVYIIEAAGSFIGGLGVTVLLTLGVSLARIFFILAFIVSSSAFAVQLAKARQNLSDDRQDSKFKIKIPLVFLLPLSVCLCLAFGADKALMHYVRNIKWTKLLPADALIGSFQTPQGEYLYGIYQGQWVAVREGSVVDALLDESTTGRIAAISLCQNPDAKRILVVGSGLGLCYQFLRLPQTELVTWAHCDNEYVQKLPDFLPAEFKITDERFHPLTRDVRSLLNEKRQLFDIVILNLPEATSSVLNRYYTRQFYRQIKENLRPNGLLAVRVAAGENIMGTELINLGASTKLTLQKVFSQFVLTPGEDSWFIASDSENLTGDPATCRDRFARIKGGGNVFAPQALLSVYLPDRAAFALENYSRADLPEWLLINRDSRPLTHLYSLLLAAKQSEAPVTKFVKHLALAGPLAFFIPLLVFIALRVIYVSRISSDEHRASSIEHRASSFDSTFLVFSAGLLGIGVVIVLMYLYQTRFGSLYLHIGLISSVFMVGLTTGAAIISSLVARESAVRRPAERIENRESRYEILLFAVIFVHALILTAIAFWPGEKWTYLIFAIAFVLCGLCTGSYFPLAARQLADSAFEAGQAGSKLETADHIGASAGGLLTGLVLVPVLGSKLTLFVFVLFILANVPLAALRIALPQVYKQQKLSFLPAVPFRLRKLGYILFGFGISVILCSNLLAAAGKQLRPSLPQYAAQALAGQSYLEQASTVFPDSAQKINYFKVYSSPETRAPGHELTGYIFSSEDLAPEVRGFGGKMNLAVYVDTTGSLINFHIIRSNETPAYLELLSQWCDSLNSSQLFQPDPFADVHPAPPRSGVHAVTGATVSSKAILLALQSSGHRFATQILGQALEPGVEEKIHRASYLPDRQGIYLISAFVLTLIVIYRGGFWSRLAILCFNLVAGGIILNTQYSSEQIATLLSFQTPALGLSGAFLLVLAVPLLVIIFGNIYCGYLCPFGAAQELLGYVLPQRFKEPLSIQKMRKARFVKYVVLFALLIVFFISRSRATLTADPLIEIFHLRFSIYPVRDFFRQVSNGVFNFQSAMLLIVVIALIGSVFYARFWCRYLCPVGAFLSLLNNLPVLKRYLPAKKFARCEFGLTTKDKMDCLYCDRCRYPRLRGDKFTPAEAGAKPAPEKEYLPRPHYAPAKLLSRYFVVAVLVVGIFVSTVSVRKFLQVVPAGFGRAAVSAPSGGQPRDVDLRRIRKMIQQNRLSDREAEFYKKVE